MDIKKIIIWGAILAGGWYIIKKTGILQKLSLGQISRLPERRQFWPQSTTYQGLGATGVPRRGMPKTEEQRKATHRALFGGDENIPPRGTGLSRGLWS